MSLFSRCTRAVFTHAAYPGILPLSLTQSAASPPSCSRIQSEHRHPVRIDPRHRAAAESVHVSLHLLLHLLLRLLLPHNMAYVIEQAAPPPVIIEQAPPPVIVQAPPPPVIIEQAPPPVLIQTNQPVVMHAPMKSVPVAMKCSFCQQQIVTSTKGISGLLTWTVVGVLFFFCIWPFCLIPFCVTSCKDIEHSCPSCHNVLYVYKRM
ncbi:hypothetical protein KOW79_020928 [Hemibagrus wyckioides]|uniref:LITAF domain-containing protein n=1 Tax=Hemibagrus wyckioides TaxID=337641 RepID=A0A9D3N5E8_9TELE|nr:hypothetical protein KOW79_020928 [Hemibagrus wyckioides]